MKRIGRLRSMWTLLCCLGGLTACPADDSGSAGAGSAGSTAGNPGSAGIDANALSFARDIQPKITEACNCHQSTPVLMAPFSLKVGEAYGTLVGTPSIQLPSMQRVKPGSLNESYLWHKINGTQLEVGGSGMIMPYTLPLRPDELDLFGRWIAAGALP